MRSILVIIAIVIEIIVLLTSNNSKYEYEKHFRLGCFFENDKRIIY